MLSKNKRLNLKTDFKWVASGKKVETKYMRLYFKNGTNEFPRIGIATSSKIFKKAVKRNRARRLASAAFEGLYDKLPKTANILVLPKIGILGVKSNDVLLDLEKVLKNEKIIN